MIKVENGELVDLKLIDYNICKRMKAPKPVLKMKRTQSVCVKNMQDLAKRFNLQFLTHIGSPYYIAPEIHCLGSYTEAVDIWGIGVILAFCLYGEKFFRVGNNKDFDDCQSGPIAQDGSCDFVDRVNQAYFDNPEIETNPEVVRLLKLLMS